MEHEFVPCGFPKDDRCRFLLGMYGYAGQGVYCDLPESSHTPEEKKEKV